MKLVGFFQLLSTHKQTNTMGSRRLLEQLKHFHEMAFVHNTWRAGARGMTFPVLNPATGETIAQVADFQEPDILEAIDSCNSAFQHWRFTPCKVRSELLKAAADTMLANSKDLASIITLECGKPIQVGGDVRPNFRTYTTLVSVRIFLQD